MGDAVPAGPQAAGLVRSRCALRHKSGSLLSQTLGWRSLSIPRKARA